MFWSSLLQVVFFLLISIIIFLTLKAAIEEISAWFRRYLSRYTPQAGDSLRRVVVAASSRSARPSGLIVERSQEPAVIVIPRRPILVGPLPRGVWEDRGWTARVERGRTIYEGFYRVGVGPSRERRQFQGRILIEARHVSAYIANPPVAIKRHIKGPCFTAVRAPWFLVHWHRPANNVDDALLYIERILDEALNR
jgi:hypothetical protein